MNKKFKYLIADTTAFLNAVPLNDYAENVLTVPDVTFEVKNRRQLRRLAVLPFDLQVQEPNDESLAWVTRFAKKTGDYASLSGIDLKVIALTYELEKKFLGTTEHLRDEPVISKTIASKTKPEELIDNVPLAGFYQPAGIHEDDEISNQEEKHQNEQSPEDNSNESEDYSEEEGDNEEVSSNLEEEFTKLNVNVDDILAPQKPNPSEEDSVESAENNSTEADDIHDDDDDDDETSWITPSNIVKIKKEYNAELEEEKNVQVACMSTDFAIQNVLKQINLNVAALNGRIINHLRTYILRCYSCFKTTSIVTKLFCPNCGNKTLKRVAVSLDKDGKQIIHINTRRPLTAKYKNQSLPRPTGGKHSRNPILVEDQPIPKQMPSRVAKTKTNALDDDYTAGYSPFVLRDVNSKSALLRQQGNIKQWARNNLYEEDRRRKTHNRLLK